MEIIFRILQLYFKTKQGIRSILSRFNSTEWRIERWNCLLNSEMNDRSCISAKKTNNWIILRNLRDFYWIPFLLNFNFPNNDDITKNYKYKFSYNYINCYIKQLFKNRQKSWQLLLLDNYKSINLNIQLVALDKILILKRVQQSGLDR